MTRPDPIRLPMRLEKTPGKSLRWLHVVISTPLMILASIAAYWGDETSIYVFALAAAISAVTEIIAHWINRNFGHQYEITATGVMHRTDREFWFEPLSAYASVDWREKMLSARQGQSFVHWEVELRHRSNPKRNVELFSCGESKGDKQSQRREWRAIAQALGLPARQVGGSGVDIVEVPAQADIASISANASSSHVIELSEIRVGQSAWARVLPLFFSAMGAVIVYQEVSHLGLETVLADFGPLLYGAVAVLIALWSWALTSYRVQVSRQAVKVLSCLGPFAYLKQRMDRRELREIVVHANRFGLASVSLQGESQPTVVVTTLRLRDAQRVQRFVQQQSQVGV